MAIGKTLTAADEGVKNFLTLLCSESDAEKLMERLDKAGPTEHAGKDLLRAASLPLLSEDDPQVSEVLKDVRKGKALAPVLLIRGDLKNAIRSSSPTDTTVFVQATSLTKIHQFRVG